MTKALILGAALVCLVLLLIVAYKIGKVLLRLAVGLGVIALLSWCLWKVIHS